MTLPLLLGFHTDCVYFVKPVVVGSATPPNGSATGLPPTFAAGLNEPLEPPTALTVALTEEPPPSTTAAVGLLEFTCTGAVLSVRLPLLTQNDLAAVGSRMIMGMVGDADGAQEATLRTVTVFCPRQWVDFVKVK